MDTEPTKIEVIEHRKDIEFIRQLLLELKKDNEKDHARIIERQSEILEDIFGNGRLGLKTKTSIIFYVVTVVVLPSLGAMAAYLLSI